METLYTLHPSGLVVISKREYDIDSPEGTPTGLSFKVDEEGYIEGNGAPYRDKELLASLKAGVVAARDSGVTRIIRSGEAKPIPQPTMSDEMRQAKAKAYDRVYNEGGEGYNPYRTGGSAQEDDVVAIDSDLDAV